MGERAVMSHFKGKKHELNCKAKDEGQLGIDSFYMSEKEKASSDVPLFTGKKSKIEDFIYDDKMATNAEIIWTMNVVQSNNSLRSCDDLPKMFQNMFPDSMVAKNFTFGKDKCGYYINYGLAPYFKSILVDDIKKSDFFSISFDESLNKSTQSCRMDLVVTYWDNIKKRTQVRYLNSSFMRHSTANDLLEHFFLQD